MWSLLKPVFNRLLGSHQATEQSTLDQAAVLANLVRPTPPTEVDREVQILLQAIMQADNQVAFIEQNLTRFTDEVLAAFAQMFEQAEGELALGFYRLLEVIDRALRQRERALLTPHQQAILDDVVALWEWQERGSYERQQALCRSLLARLSREQTPRQWAHLQYISGVACKRLYDLTGESSYMRAAEMYYMSTLKVYQRELAPSQWATTQYALGNLFSRRYQRTNQQADGQKAEAHYIRALEVYQREVAPSEWATTQYALGNLFSRCYQHTNQQADGEKAEAYYIRTLEVYQREEAPSEWAMTQYALGNLFSIRYERTNQHADGQRAEAHYTSALEVKKHEVAPNLPLTKRCCERAHGLGSKAGPPKNRHINIKII